MKEKYFILYSLPNNGTGLYLKTEDTVEAVKEQCLTLAETGYNVNHVLRGSVLSKIHGRDSKGSYILLQEP